MENRKDYTSGDHSFKNWFKIMWKNKYIQLFAVGLAGIIVQLAFWSGMMDMISENFYDSTMGGIITIVTMLLPTFMVSIISYKGFWQFWNDLKNGDSR